jgi:hypothetical protein
MAREAQAGVEEVPSGIYFFDHQLANEPDHDLDEVVARLGAVCGSHSLGAALQAGRIIFESLFKGDERLLRARGKKCSSFRKLANHPRLGMSPSSLWRAVAIFELSRRFPELQHYTHIGVGHVSVVLGLPSATQFQLLRQCESERWTRRHLQTLVLQARGEVDAIAGAPSARVVDHLRGLEVLLGDAQNEDNMARLRPDEIRQALVLIERIRTRFGEVSSKLYTRLPSELRPGVAF